MEWRSTFSRLGLFITVLLLCLGAMLMMSMNTRGDPPRFGRLSKPRGLGPGLGPLGHHGKTAAAMSRLKMMPFHNPLMERLAIRRTGSDAAGGAGLPGGGDKPMFLDDQDIGVPLSDKYVTTSSDAINMTNTPANQRPMLLIAGYLRTGSTFTASLFAQHPGTFYVFEPLHMVMESVQKKHYIRYINGTMRKYNQTKLDPTTIHTVTQNWLHCNLQELDRDTLEDKFHSRYSKSMRPFVTCLHQRQGRSFLVRIGSAYSQCLPPVTRSCNAAQLRVFKTIRLRMAAVEKLMRLNPNLKVIHLVRDPRGMFHSQLRQNFVRRGRETTAMQEFCSHMAVDIEISKRLIKQGEKKIHVIRYEDIAYDPLYQVRQLYKFANLEVDSRILSYVKQSTSMNLRDNCAYCTRRSNSTKTANLWRDKIDAPFLKSIDRHCGGVYRSLGYIPLGFNDVRNRSIPSVSPESLFDLMKDDRYISDESLSEES